MTRQGDLTYIDEALPSWDRRERHRIPCNAAPVAVMRAAEQVTWREVPVFRGLIRRVWLRAIRRRARLLDQRPGTAAP